MRNQLRCQTCDIEIYKIYIDGIFEPSEQLRFIIWQHFFILGHIAEWKVVE